MVEIKTAWVHAVDSRKLVEFIEVVVADEVCPQSTVGRPTRGINKNGHTLIIETWFAGLDTTRHTPPAFARDKRIR